MKMTAKKRWLTNCVDLTQAEDTSASHISWSSSSSEREEQRNFKSRKKFEVSFRSKSLTNRKSKRNYNATKAFRSTVAESPDDVKPSKSGTHSFEESPIVGRLSLEETSPILNKALRGVSKQQFSPIIGEGHPLKELKRKCGDSEVKDRKCEGKSAPKIMCFKPSDSFDYACTQSTLIIDSTSPAQHSKGIAVLHSNEDRSIEPITSQGSTEEEIISSYSSGSMSGSRGEPVLYYHIIPKKKRYKKGGLARQLQKALQRQRSSIGIWKHEVYLSKLKNESDLFSSEFVHLSVNKMWTEFDTHLLKCHHVDRTGNECVLVLKGEDCINVNSELKLYPPYNMKAIKYDGETLDCYYNISKVLTCELKKKKRHYYYF